MGVVWAAWDPMLERRVAIKLMRPEVGEHGPARLLREARALAQLQHPNVVAVHDVGEHEGEVFLATELVDGEPLDRWQVGRGADAIVEIYVQAARGLAAAHAIGLVHRDIKPSNIFVAKDGRARVGDFGLARRMDAGRRRQRRGADARGPRRRHAGVHGARAARGSRDDGARRSIRAVRRARRGVERQADPDPDATVDELAPDRRTARANVLARGLRASKPTNASRAWIELVAAAPIIDEGAVAAASASASTSIAARRSRAPVDRGASP